LIIWLAQPSGSLLVQLLAYGHALGSSLEFHILGVNYTLVHYLPHSLESCRIVVDPEPGLPVHIHSIQTSTLHVIIAANLDLNELRGQYLLF